MTKKNKQTPPSQHSAVARAASDAAQQKQVQGIALMHSEEHVTTIFDPNVVRAYQAMVPDAPERILQQFEKNSEAQRQSQKDATMLAKEAMDKQAADNRRRDWLAFALMALIVVVSGLFAWLGMHLLAGGTLVGLFAYIGLAYFKWRK